MQRTVAERTKRQVKTDNQMTFLNFYVHCRVAWTDEWDCMCNDECPECHTKDIQPYESMELNPNGTPGEVIRHVPEGWIPEHGWTEEETTEAAVVITCSTQAAIEN